MALENVPRTRSFKFVVWGLRFPRVAGGGVTSQQPCRAAPRAAPRSSTEAGDTV